MDQTAHGHPRITHTIEVTADNPMPTTFRVTMVAQPAIRTQAAETRPHPRAFSRPRRPAAACELCYVRERVARHMNALSPMALTPLSTASHYRPDIDGLRAVAVVSVVLYHFGLGCPGGYVGVDVFFVISGFLITRVLSASAPSSGLLKFLMEFWLRRVRRLAPALAVTTLLTLVATYPFIGSTDRLHAAWASLYQLGFAANFYFIHDKMQGWQYIYRTLATSGR